MSKLNDGKYGGLNQQFKAIFAIIMAVDTVIESLFHPGWPLSRRRRENPGKEPIIKSDFMAQEGEKDMLGYGRSEKLRKYLRDKRGGLGYTVDEVSERLGVPRPTLYRYLREYAVPYSRRAGRIQIPEESVEKIRRVRRLHDEGLGTDAVRRRLREGEGPDADWLAERMDRLSETVESLQRNPRISEAPSHALNTVLARQSLMLSAVFNMTEMLEELLVASGVPRRTSSIDYPDAEAAVGVAGGGTSPMQTTVLERSPEPEVVDPPSPTEPIEAYAPPPNRTRFGTLARRRRATLATLIVFCAAGILVFLALALNAL